MFKLNIECSKDIDELHINFSDGTSSVVTNHNLDSPKGNTHKSTEPQENNHKKSPRHAEFIDTDGDFGSISQEIVELPDVTRDQKTVKVAEEMQNLDF